MLCGQEKFNVGVMMNSMEKLPQNTSEAIRFSGGLSKLIRNMRDQLDETSQGIARAADLISFYEAELAEIANAKGFDNIGNWARNKAKTAIKKGKKL